tara:strand:- start:194 stop:316 length:123 start_codon:yes stop_codon:yes gene_type:complete
MNTTLQTILKMTKTTPTRKNLKEAEEIAKSFFPDTKPSTK